ncbi:unnamed protein product [Closterium sp. Naga37s-1]|nr:unnamed protein product [Closterium sp. Naga37s-1]
MVSGKLSETAEGSVELVHYDSAQLHTKRPEVMEGVKNLDCPSPDVCVLMLCVCWQPEDIPQQSNAVDCGIYVGMYLHTLVSSGFSTLKEWMSFYGVKSHAYRRQLLEEVSLHATGDLIVKLLGEGVDVPVQPLPQLGEHGALVFPKEDEVRTDLARQSGMITRMEVGGYVVCAAVMCLARSLGISEDQLLSGAAHELQAHGTPLLALSTSKNHVDHAASMRTLGMTIHPTPCPIPVPSFPPAHFDGASTIQMDPTPTDANPMRAEQDHPTAPVTPAAPPTVSRVAKYTTRQGSRTASRAVCQTSMFAAYGSRPASSRWTGVSWCTRGRKWGVKMVCGPGTGQQIRLGAYNVELDAAYAYAATAFVIRRKDHIPHTKELSDAEKASLDGCVRDDVRHLVKARMWWRWRQWRTAMAELGIAPGTPFPLENHGARSTGNSSGDDDSSRQIDETAASSGKAGRRRKRQVQDVIEGSARVDGEHDAPPAPSLDDDPNEDLPRRNPVNTQDEDGAEADNNAEADAEEDDAGAERAPDDAPVTREDLNSMRKLHEATARAIARLETAFLAKPKDDVNNKKRRRRKRGSGKGKRQKARRSRSTSETASDEEGGFDDENEGHLRHSTSAIMQEALDLLPTDKGWKARTELFIRRSNSQLTFYPSSAAKTWAICAVVDNLTESYASVALAACKARRIDLNRSFSDWKTGAAGRVRDISLPRIGLFRHDRDMKSKLALSRWSCDRDGMPFASGAFTACARAAFKPRMVNGTVTLKLYHVAWLEHVVRRHRAALQGLKYQGESPHARLYVDCRAQVTDAVKHWEARQGRFYNSASTNAQIVDGLHVLVQAAVRGAIADFRPAYDEASQSWAWGRHGLRISADGIAAADAVTAEASVSCGSRQA